MTHLGRRTMVRFDVTARRVGPYSHLRVTTSPITSWQIEKGKVETVTDFLFLGSKVTADSGCSHEIKRHLLLGRKARTNLHNALNSRDISLLTKIHLVKSIVFRLWSGIWTIKKAEDQRIDAFELWC